MPIIIPKDIPAFSTLKRENIFVMTEKRAVAQDIRPIEVAVVNLMPTKEVTETQLIRLLSNTPLQVNITLVHTASHRSRNVSDDYLQRFYKNFGDIRHRKFDAMIITGAPVETLEYSEVNYWGELSKIMDFADSHVTTTLFICWGAQAALKHYYGIEKYPLESKLFGVFPHRAVERFDPLMKGLDDVFYIPHSRHTAIRDQDIEACEALSVLAWSEQAGCAIVKSNDNKRFFFTGHSEYDRDTLKREYERDLLKGLDVKPPENYFVGDSDEVDMKWLSTANLLYYNWLNYYVYQVTPYSHAVTAEE